MNRRIWCLGWILVLAVFLLTSCGREEAADDFFDIIVEEETVFPQDGGSDFRLRMASPF